MASFGDSSPNASVCSENLTRMINSTVNFVDELREASNETLNRSAESFGNMLGSIHPIIFSCYQSLFEYGEVALIYGETIVDGLQLVYNIIHHLGGIYDTIFYLVKWHKDHPFADNPQRIHEETEGNEEVEFDFES